MKRLILRLSLSGQVFERMFARDLYAEDYEAQEIVKRIFEIEISFLSNGVIEPETRPMTL